MSDSFRFELNREAVGQLLKSEEMEDILFQAANTIAIRAGDDFEAWHAPTRVVVQARTQKGEQDNLDNNTLLKAVGENGN